MGIVIPERFVAAMLLPDRIKNSPLAAHSRAKKLASVSLMDDDMLYMIHGHAMNVRIGSHLFPVRLFVCMPENSFQNIY